MLNKLRKIAGVMVALGGAAFGVNSYLATQANVMFFDNTTNQPVELRIDGEPVATIAPGATHVQEFDPGSHELKASAGGAEIASRRFDVPEGSAFRGLIPIGDERQYVVVRVRYDSAGGDTQVIPVELANGVALLPADVAPDGLDLSFPDSMTSSGDSVTLTHVCHFDSSSETVGCPGV